ncbi:unnamed protein product [Dibothriocephalus latus]|uniref:Uncharacterized protein n=1 Tax=Dibothriocephalus latus TaxID=60516 RepID=A0A3P7NV80_DIBLA|nr:unnamed protein product [Dibothriocephalus latus]
MPLGLASTLPLGNGRVLCSFKLNSTVRALVKLYDDVAEFNFLIEYLKLLQSVTNDRHLRINEKSSSGKPSNALNTNVFRTVVREVYNQRSVSVPSRILPNSDSSLSENTSLISEPSEFSKSPWEALCEQQQAKSWHSTPSLVCEEEFPESTVGQTYDIYGPSPYEINTLNFCENEAVCHQPPVLMVCNISSLEGLGEEVVANECFLIYESLRSLRCTEAKLVSGCQVEVVRTRISPSLFSNVGQNESHNSMLRPPGHRGSLSILEQRLCLKDLMSIATRVKLHNGETACEVPLPSASMRFVIKPTDIRKVRAVFFLFDIHEYWRSID